MRHKPAFRRLLAVPVLAAGIFAVAGLHVSDAAAAPVADTVGCPTGDCDNGKGDCIPEPILTCDGLQGKKCVFVGHSD